VESGVVWDPPIKPSPGFIKKNAPERTDRCAVWIGTGLGVGWIPVAPGTFGTLWGLPLTWCLLQLASPGWQLLALVLLWLSGVWICGAAARSLGQKDPGPVVWDELTALPLVFLGHDRAMFASLSGAAAGFLLFRLFDISKFPPGRQAERLRGGWGIMADDLVAAAYAWIALWALVRWTSWL
jgi:phosphatidylglycerophosphatase A